jgi:hypothetical protein
LPIIAITRLPIDRTPGMLAMPTDVPYITISKDIHPKTSIFNQLVQQRKNLGFPQQKVKAVKEYLTIPFPDFCTVPYEIEIWSQYQSQMNQILEKISFNYIFKAVGSFVMYTKYDKAKKGEGYRLVGFRDGNFEPQTNVDEFTEQERIIKYKYRIKVPAYLILDPKDETLAYGRNRDNSKTDDNSKVVYKNQSVVDVRVQEGLMVNGNSTDIINETDILLSSKNTK